MSAVQLFSPKFKGSKEAWEWVCSVSNNKPAQMPKLNQQQLKYALQAGYIVTSEFNEAVTHIGALN